MAHYRSAGDNSDSKMGRELGRESGPELGQELDQELGEVFVISVAAELAGMHAQTLRTYDRMGLVTPMRTRGGGRRYSRRDVAMLRKIQQLSQDEGVNLAGIKAIIELTEENERLKGHVEDLLAKNESLRAELAEEKTKSRSATRPHGELVHVPRSTSIVMWEPRTAKVKARERARRRQG